MTMHKALHLTDDIDKLYCMCKEKKEEKGSLALIYQHRVSKNSKERLNKPFNNSIGNISTEKKN